MTTIGTIQAFNEENNIGEAVESLFTAGCDRVVVLDGAWTNPDGSFFGGGGLWSSDNTVEYAVAAGADVYQPAELSHGDTQKRDLLIRYADAEEGDHLLLLDADERVRGELIPDQMPSGHACVVLRNRPNDIADARTPSLIDSFRKTVPLLRWLRYGTGLRCERPGRYLENDEPIEPYLVDRLRREIDIRPDDELFRWAYTALRDVELTLPDKHLSALPIVPGIEIEHLPETRHERVEAKIVYHDCSGGRAWQP